LITNDKLPERRNVAVAVPLQQTVVVFINHKYTRSAEKLALPSVRRLDLEDLVEAGVDEDVSQMLADALQAQPAGRAHQALLRLEQHAEAGAGDVLQAAEVERDDSTDAVEKGLRVAAWAASSRPVTTTAPSAPDSIAIMGVRLARLRRQPDSRWSCGR